MKGDLLARGVRVSKRAKFLPGGRAKIARQHKIDGEWGGGASAGQHGESLLSFVWNAFTERRLQLSLNR